MRQSRAGAQALAEVRDHTQTILSITTTSVDGVVLTVAKVGVLAGDARTVGAGLDCNCGHQLTMSTYGMQRSYFCLVTLALPRMTTIKLNSRHVTQI